MGQQAVGPLLAQRTASAAERCAYRFKDHCFWHFQLPGHPLENFINGVTLAV
jgi:hypothetical protein